MRDAGDIDAVIIEVPFTRPVTYSFDEIPREVPQEVRGAFPDGVAKSAVFTVDFDGNKYQLFDTEGDSNQREAIDIATGDIVTLDFTEVQK